jgi:hypothetical protein
VSSCKAYVLRWGLVNLLLRLALSCNPPISTFWAAGITGHHAWPSSYIYTFCTATLSLVPPWGGVNFSLMIQSSLCNLLWLMEHNECDYLIV